MCLHLTNLLTWADLESLSVKFTSGTAIFARHGALRGMASDFPVSSLPSRGSGHPQGGASAR